MNNSFGIAEKTYSELLEGLSELSQIHQAKIFGSRAMGNFKKGSDLDIALYGDDIDQTLLNKLIIYFEEMTTIPYFIDFVHYNTLDNHELKNHIDSCGVVIYKKGSEKY